MAKIAKPQVVGAVKPTSAVPTQSASSDVQRVADAIGALFTGNPYADDSVWAQSWAQLNPADVCAGIAEERLPTFAQRASAACRAALKAGKSAYNADTMHKSATARLVVARVLLNEASQARA